MTSGEKIGGARKQNGLSKEELAKNVRIKTCDNKMRIRQGNAGYGSWKHFETDNKS